MTKIQIVIGDQIDQTICSENEVRLKNRERERGKRQVKSIESLLQEKNIVKGKREEEWTKIQAMGLFKTRDNQTKLDIFKQ